MNNEQVQKILELVKNNYQEISSDFDKTRKKSLWSEVDNYCEQILPGQKVLDLACGNGRLFPLIKERQANYLGVDNSSNLINLARKNQPLADFVLGDMLEKRNLPQEYKFDHVFCLAALQHIPSNELRVLVLENIKELLSEGGRAVISNWNIWRSHKKWQAYLSWPMSIWPLNLSRTGDNRFLEKGDIIFPWRLSNGSQSNRYYHAFTLRELKKLAYQAGFREVKVDVDKRNYWLILNK